MFKSIKIFFTSIDYSALRKSLREVFYLTAIALFPMIFNIIIVSVSTNSILPLSAKLIPGEMLSYCLSFLAPSLYLIIKTHGSGYRLPLLHLFSITTFIIYLASMLLYFIAKNNWVPSIDMENHNGDLYFKLTLLFLVLSIAFRIYAVYHGMNASNWSDTRNRQQSDFNENFIESIK